LEELNLKNDSFPVYIDNVEIKEFNKDRRDTSIQGKNFSNEFPI